MTQRDPYRDRPDSEDTPHARQQSGRAGVRASHQKEDGARGARDLDPASRQPGGAHGRRGEVSAGQPSGAPGLQHGGPVREAREGEDERAGD
jgi:hypothetical protein